MTTKARLALKMIRRKAGPDTFRALEDAVKDAERFQRVLSASLVGHMEFRDKLERINPNPKTPDEIRAAIDQAMQEEAECTSGK